MEWLINTLIFAKIVLKKRVNDHRNKNIDKIREYDRKRDKTEKRKAKSKEITKKRRQEVKGYNIAHKHLESAVNNGKVAKSIICQVCGEKTYVEGHHFDYQHPLLVIWLCRVCHRQYHTGKSERANMVKIVVDGIADIQLYDQSNHFEE